MFTILMRFNSYYYSKIDIAWIPYTNYLTIF
nr:MAG TPA: hypothetical protein [Caudoviricetes sp.]